MRIKRTGDVLVDSSIHLLPHGFWCNPEESEGQILIKTLCCYLRLQHILLRNASVSEGVSEGVLSKFQEILGEPDGNEKVVLRHQQLLIVVCCRHPPDVFQICSTQLGPECTTDKWSLNPSRLFRLA